MSKQKMSQSEKWILLGILVIFLQGSFLHFAYQLSGKQPLIGLLVPINESVWEHTKMVLLPIILWWIIYYIIMNKKEKINKDKWFTAALLSLIITIVMIPLLYYFYTQAFGVEFLIADIIILLVSVMFGQLFGLHYYKHGKGINANFVVILFCIIICVFMLFTTYPPDFPMFQQK